MKSLNTCVTENCIPSSSSCVEWNGGDIPFLGICNGESINNVIAEIVVKIQGIVGNDLSTFDINTLLTVCTQNAPLEVTLLSILNVLKQNDICLKDYIDVLAEKVAALSTSSNLSVNLKCYANLDNLGNALQITRDQLDQLVIDQLCSHKGRLDTVEGKLTALQAQVNGINPEATVVEPLISTCIDGTPKATSQQVQAVALEVCALENANGNPSQIAISLAKTPSTWNTKFSTILGWDLTPSQWASSYGNLLLVVNDLEARLLSIEQNCCQVKCSDIKLGFTAIMNDAGDAVTLTFNYGAGTEIPNGFVDKGSTGTITDQLGNVEYFMIPIANNFSQDITVAGLDLTGPVTINITSKIGNGSTLCVGCLDKVITLQSGCCLITNSTSGDVTIFYETPISAA